MDLALRLGVDKFYEYMQKLGLGSKTGVGIAGEGSGILMAKSQVRTVDLARMGFGHAVALTPMQLLSAVASIVNGGTYNVPRVLGEVIASSGERTEVQGKVKEKGIISAQTSAQVNYLLEKAENKTGSYTFVEGYNVGGKTGTAQKYSESGGIAQGKYISSFIGTYPADDPQYLVFIMVDEPSAGAYYGSIVAAPYGKIVFSNLFDYLGEKKQDESVAIKYVEMPNLVGDSLADAAGKLKALNLCYELDGEGEFVLAQLPPAGSMLAEGTYVVLIT